MLPLHQHLTKVILKKTKITVNKSIFICKKVIQEITYKQISKKP